MRPSVTLSALAVFAHSVGTLPNVDAFATAVNSVKNLLGVIGEGTANDSPGSAQSEAGVGNLGEGYVYIIRHGEKIGGDRTHKCLSSIGQRRADNLFKVFTATHLGVPRAMFANKYHDGIDCERCIQTAMPTAEHYGVKLNTQHGVMIYQGGGNAGAAKAIKAALVRTQGPVLVVWEHINIQYLTADLGVAKANIPYWPGPQYDTIYKLKFSIAGGTARLLSFEAAAEGLNDVAKNVLPAAPNVCNTAAWPDKDHNLVCGDCKVLVNNMKSKYGGLCDNYCASLQAAGQGAMKCVGAWEEDDDTCAVDYTGACARSFGSTSDAICQCAPTVAGAEDTDPQNER